MREFLSSIDAERAVEHATWLTNNAPYRLAGSESDNKAAYYLAEQMESIGLNVQMIELMGYLSHPQEGSLRVVSPEGVRFSAPVWSYNVSTPPGGLEAEVAYCGRGREEDFADKDVQGKIVLVNLSFFPTPPEQTRLAQLGGAVGCLVMNFLPGEYDNLPQHNWKPVFGNPTDQNFHLVKSEIPAGGVHRATGDRMMELLQQGPLRIRLQVATDARWRKLLVPIGYLPADGSEDFALLSAHHCSWSVGATDNASGNGALLEIARAAVENRERLRRGVMAAFWTGHEQGMFAGSTWFVDTMWDRLDEHMVMDVILDGMGRRQTNELAIRCVPEVREMAARTLKEALGLEAVEVRDLRKTADQAFVGIGIPMVFVKSDTDTETLKIWPGADASWWWHSEADTLDKLDPNGLRREAVANAALLWEVCTSEVLPFRFKGLADRMVTRLRELQGIVGEHLDLSLALSWAERFQPRAAALDIASEGGKHTSNLQMRMSRTLSSAYFSITGRWAQDMYGLTDMTTFIPALRPVTRLPKLQGTDDYYLLLNRMLRERNRVRDGIREACRILEDAGI